jgi:hypothetical protein
MQIVLSAQLYRTALNARTLKPVQRAWRAIPLINQICVSFLSAQWIIAIYVLSDRMGQLARHAVLVSHMHWMKMEPFAYFVIVRKIILLIWLLHQNSVFHV